MNTPLRKREGPHPSETENSLHAGTTDFQAVCFQTVFQAATRSAARCWRRARARRFLSLAVMILAGLAMLWLALLLFAPSWVKPLPAAGALAGAGLLSLLLAAWLLPIRRDALLHAIDRRLSLPDLALSADELPAPTAWNDRLRAQAAEALSGVEWKAHWPAPWSKGSGLASFTLAITLPLLTGIYRVEMAIPALLAQPSKHDTARKAAFEALFNDWEQAAKEEPSEEWQKFLEQIAPLREKLVSSETDEREAFVQLNRMEELLAGERARLEAESLAQHGAALADTFQPMEGMGALAAALRSGSFGRAEELAAAAGNALSAPGASIPQGADKAAQNARQLEKTLPGTSGLAQGLRKFSQGADQKNASQMSQGMRSLQQSLNQDNRNRQRQQQMQKQLEQLAECKSCMGNDKYLNFSQMPSLCQGESNSNAGQQNGGGSGRQQGGSQAGTEKGENHLGAATEIDARHQTEQVSGSVTDGDSETTLSSSIQRTQEATRTGSPAAFTEYEKLSQEAIHDETIPAAYRQTIRAYFERIRPENTR